MQIDDKVERDIRVFGEPSEHLLEVEVFWCAPLGWLRVLAVEVKAAEGCAVVAKEHAVWVQHRQDDECDLPLAL